jgi:hypothetical protein
MILEHRWVLAFRTDFLTAIFKLFPFLASDYFYIAVIAIGYWLNPSSLMFRSLGFLVPFATLINCLLKNIFRISRPDGSLHLVPVLDYFGFPSGDVQVAVVFWIIIFLNLKSMKWRYLCLLPVIGIAISRVYLGVHSIYDVIGGFGFGSCTIYVWRKYLEIELSLDHPSNEYKKLWGLSAITILLYLLASQGLYKPHVVAVAIGALIGFCASLPSLGKQTKMQSMHFFTAIICLVIVVAIVKLAPIIKINEWSIFFSLALKYSIVVFSIFVLIPKIAVRLDRYLNKT